MLETLRDSSASLPAHLPLFHGLSAFPITPADEHGIVDTQGLATLVERLAGAGVHSIGLLGSTGTYIYLSREERRRAIAAAAEAVNGRVPLIVGVGAMRTDAARALAKDAEAEGAAGLLLAPVSYTPLTQEEAYRHFLAVAEATSLPLCIYNNPGTTHFTFSPQLIDRLAEVPAIAAVKMPLPKDGDIAGELRALRAGRASGLAIGYSGDWGAADALLAGADCWYSVIAGVHPELALAMVGAARRGDADTVRSLDNSLQPLWALFQELGSLRVIYAMLNQLGSIRAQPPKPVLPLSPADAGRVAAAMNGLF